MSAGEHGFQKAPLGQTEFESFIASLGRLSLFKDLDASLLRAVANETTWFSVPGGTTLFETGQQGDALYFVMSGCLGAFVHLPDGRTRLVGHITAGQTAGEMALVTGRPRSATVIALRDTELGALSKRAFDALMLSHPQGLLRIAQLTVERLEASQRYAESPRAIPKTWAVIPHDESVDSMKFAQELVTCLSHIGRTELVPSGRGVEHTSSWFHKLECANEFVVYVGDAQHTKWRRLCTRQSDLLLLVARAQMDVSRWTTLAMSRQSEFELRRSELVLLHDKQIARGAARQWLDIRPDVNHHNVCGRADVARLVRILTGRAVGLALSGGGARGFAHIGVIRAFREARVPIDAVGGTSIGAIIAAGCAAGWQDEELIARFRRTFVDTNPLADYTLPLVSLVSGRKVGQLLRQEFGDLDIEDLQLPYFCVSANLTTGARHVHRRGPLWRWLRASIAIPGVLPPVFSHGEVHVDGATISNLPVDVMRQFMRGRVVGVDVGADRALSTDMDDLEVPSAWRIVPWFRRRRRHINILQILLRASMINSDINDAAQRQLSDLFIKPPLEHIDLLDWQAFDRAIEVGYRYASEQLQIHGDRLRQSALA